MRSILPFKLLLVPRPRSRGYYSSRLRGPIPRARNRDWVISPQIAAFPYDAEFCPLSASAYRTSSRGNASCIFTLSRHRASKVSESFSARACESNGLPGFSVATLVISRLETGCADASLGHSNNDFESMGLPSYQHCRPSIRR
jgi:hypothetical protein